MSDERRKWRTLRGRLRYLWLGLLWLAAVGGASFATAPRYELTTGQNAEQTVKDYLTSLEWALTDCERMSWKDALGYCESLQHAGHTDWHLPDVLELSSIVDEQQEQTAVNTTFFLDFQSAEYWTSTSLPLNTGHVYAVFFNDVPIKGLGGVGSYNKQSHAEVLCVRDFQLEE